MFVVAVVVVVAAVVVVAVLVFFTIDVALGPVQRMESVLFIS